MKKGQFFIALILVLLLCAWKMQTPAHNQEVVLEFNNEQLNSFKVKGIVNAIKKELKNYGIEDIQVYEDNNSVLKISYHSEEDVQTIKTTLESLKPGDFPSHEIPIKGDDNFNSQLSKGLQTYKLEVFEIQESSDGHSGFGGKLAIVVLDEFSKPINHKTFTALNKKSTQNHWISTYRCSNIFGSQIIYLAKASNLIPDVRAGPLFT